jgi:hypothetical protein
VRKESIESAEVEFELILSPRQTVSAFLIIVMLLVVFFSMGYIVGRNSTPLTSELVPLDREDAAIRRELQKLRDGRAEIEWPTNLTVGVSTSVKVRLAPIQGRTEPNEDQSVIPIGLFMRVALKADSNESLVIAPLTSEEQVLGNEAFWEWTVTPKAATECRLHAVINVRLKIPAFPEQNAENRVISKTFTIQPNRPYSAWRFLSTYWQWLVSSLLIPLAAWLWSVFKRRTDKDRVTRILTP